MNLRKQERLIESSQKLIKNSWPIIYPTEKVENYPLIVKVECSKEEITAFLEDGRKVSIPTSWYPRTRNATLKQLRNFRISSDKYGIHWPDLDEDLSIRAFFKGPSGH